MLSKLEKLLREGAIFQVPEQHHPWVLYDESDNEICRGDTLSQMVEKIPGPNTCKFEDLELKERFRYFGELYSKENSNTGVGFDGPWKFAGDEEVEKI